jgi:hypothetical protein
MIKSRKSIGLKGAYVIFSADSDKNPLRFRELRTSKIIAERVFKTIFKELPTEGRIVLTKIVNFKRRDNAKN